MLLDSLSFNPKNFKTYFFTLFLHRRLMTWEKQLLKLGALTSWPRIQRKWPKLTLMTLQVSQGKHFLLHVEWLAPTDILHNTCVFNESASNSSAQISKNLMNSASLLSLKLWRLLHVHLKVKRNCLKDIVFRQNLVYQFTHSLIWFYVGRTALEKHNMYIIPPCSFSHRVRKGLKKLLNVILHSWFADPMKLVEDWKWKSGVTLILRNQLKIHLCHHQVWCETFL